MLRYALVFLLMVSCLAGTATAVSAWAIGTHLYIAEHSFRILDPNYIQDALYGAMLPDITGAYLFIDKRAMADVRFHTHGADYMRLVDQVQVNPDLYDLAAGWATHNEMWGADFYAHQVNPITLEPPGYIDVKAKAILPKLSQLIRTEYVETAIDILVERNLDHQLGKKIYGVAKERSSGVPAALVSAYSQVLDARELVRAESVFRDSAISYGAALSLRGSADKYTAAQLLGARHHISFFTSLKYLERAYAGCAPDYRLAIGNTIGAIANH